MQIDGKAFGSSHKRIGSGNWYEISNWRVRPAGGGVPFGMQAAHIYDFAAHPTPGELDALVVEGDREAKAERQRRGIP